VDLALSLSATGRLRLQVTTVDPSGTAQPTTLRVSIGRGRTPGGGTTLLQQSSSLHRVVLPRLGKPGRYFYDVTISAGGATRTYPARGRYQVMPTVRSGQALAVMCWGDSRPESTAPSSPEPAAFVRLVASALAHRPLPSLALAGGDLVNGPLDTSAEVLDEKYAVFMKTENALAHRMPVMAVPGNHENPNSPARGAAWRRWFDFPAAGEPSRLYYSFDNGDLHVVALDSATTAGSIGYVGPGAAGNSAQADWLVSDLEANRSRWTVVMLHHPLFDPKATDPWSTIDRGERDALARLFASEGVDLVLQGHIHNYRRHEEPVSATGTVRHVTYVTEGGGGAPLYPVTLAPRDRYDAQAFEAYGYLVLRSTGAGTLVGVAYRFDSGVGAVKVGDRFTVDQVPRGAVDEGLGR
jgi:3',5'-cyclic AMP phosphodiesterase CpdA